MRSVFIGLCLLVLACGDDDDSSSGGAGSGSMEDDAGDSGQGSGDGGAGAGTDAGGMTDAGANSGADAGGMNDGGGMNDAAASTSDAGADAGSDAGGNADGPCGWQITAGGALYDQATDVLALDDGSVVVVGYASQSAGGVPFSATGGFVMRVSVEGAVDWATSIPGASVKSVAPGLDDGVVVVAGVAQTDEACPEFFGATDAWVAEIALDDGAIAGSACIGGDDDDSAVGAQAAAGGFYRVFGTVDSHDNGNVGPNHNLGTFAATDILIAAWDPGGGAEGWCYGSEGPDGAIAMLDADSAVTFASGGATGDLEEWPVPESADVMVVAVDTSEACLDPPCASPAWFGGSDNETVTAGRDHVVTGITGSSTGGLHCTGAAQGQERAWLGLSTAGTVTRVSCLWNGGNILPTGLGRGHGTVVMVGRANPFDMEDFADAVVDGDKATGNAAFMAIYDDGDALALSPKQLVVVGTLPQVRLTAAAIREDGCVIAVGEAAPGAATDVFVYSRPLPE